MKSALLLLPLITGCIVVPVDNGFPPRIDSAVSFVAFDAGYRDDVFTFEATVTDPDGDLDFVFADVVDDVTGNVVDTFDLFDQGGAFWASDWLVSTTYLDPYFYPDYSVDLVAVDFENNTDVVTVLPGIY